MTSTPDNAPPDHFATATVASVQRAVDDAIAEAEQHVAGILASDPSFDDTLAPLDRIAATLAEAYGRGPFFARVHPDEEVRDAASAAEEKLRKFEVGLASRHDLYLAVEAFADTDEADDLEGEPARLLAHWRRDFRRAGTHLPEQQRAEAERVRERLVELEVAFQRNVDEYEDSVVVTKDDLAGLPDDFIEGLDARAEPGTFEVSLDYPERFPFLNQSEARDKREELSFKAGNIAVADNRAILEEVLQLRDKLAELLGHPSWAHHAMEPRMADPDRVEALYDELIPALKDAATREVAQLEEMLEADGHSAPLATWDYRYYDTRFRREEHGLDPDELKQYFPLEAVLDGMFDLTAEVLGLRYVPSDDAEAWHPDVRRVEIRDADSDEHIAWFYMDLHPRKGKFTHAAVFPLVPGRREPEGFVRPVAAIVANFPKPTEDRPALLRHDDVETLFHEFGHILHDCLTTAEFARFSGTNTEWDFVEAPSQIMEHWAWHPDVLKRFARHHDTGETIPDHLVKQLVATRYVNQGLYYLRQCYFGRLDLALHVADEARDLDRINRDAHAVTMLPFHEGTFMPASFAHIMGGYDAGYYGYLWAQVFGDDMFSRFEQEGVTSPEVGRDYREKVLEPGGSKEAEDLLRDFLGREPSKEAFLRQLGIS
ncbi:MAG: M3 family metallopeptidase [Nitriliruptorales bacterium]|nr:M3 family metallopeptidase [Nitriliruptorales bacterium]